MAKSKRRYGLKQSIVALANELGCEFTPAQLRKVFHRNNPKSIQVTLVELVKGGELERVKHGVYRAAPTVVVEDAEPAEAATYSGTPIPDVQPINVQRTAPHGNFTLVGDLDDGRVLVAREDGGLLVVPSAG